MNRALIILIMACTSIVCYSQKNSKKIVLSEGTDISNVVFDYFRQEFDSTVYEVGSVFLMPSDSLSFKSKNEYTIKVSNPENGYLEVYFKSRLLYKYMVSGYEVNGTGFCYYPFSGRVALEGRFKNGKLNGLVFIQTDDGEMIESMVFKNGKYIRHIFHWLSYSKKSMRIMRKNRSANPIRNDELIVR